MTMTAKRIGMVLGLLAIVTTGCDALPPPAPVPQDAPALQAARTPMAPRDALAARAAALRIDGTRLARPGGVATRVPAGLERLSNGLATLFDADGLPLAGAAARTAASAKGIRMDNDRVQVVVHRDRPGSFLRGDTATLGSVPFLVDAAVEGQTQGWVRVADLPRLSRDPRVRAVTVPVPPRTTAITSEGLVRMNVPTVQALNIKGQGQKIAILDVGFTGYAALLGTELPAVVTAKSFYGAAPGDITGGGEVHGTAVAEVVYDVAPSAQLYLVNYDSEVTFKTAVDWLIAQGVDVITTSTGTFSWENTDGTGPVAQKANAARDAGIVFTAAAGNNGDSHHRATFTPSGVAEYHKFYSSGANILFLADDGTNIYYIPKDSPILVDLVWDDWGANNGTPTSTVDYDLYLAMYDETVTPAAWTIVAAAEDVQGGAAFPRESIGVYAPQDAAYGLVVAKKTATAANRPFDLYIANIFSDLNLFGPDILVPAGSVISPCVGAKVLCVGAVDVNDALLAYSSRGPSHPNGTGTTISKPDFAAPSEVSTATYPKNATTPAGFGGTSGATPHAAGVAALFLQLAAGDPAIAEAQMKTAAVDLGAVGRDDTYGYGRVRAVPCWTSLCDDGLACTTDTCHATLGCQHAASGVGCLIEGACVANGAANPGNACQKCDQAAPTQWTALTNGSACAGDGDDCTLDQCQAGACAHPSAPNATPCPDDGFTCTSDSCQSGTCQHAVATGCLVDGACRAAGASNPDNPCQQCAPANRTRWTDKAVGTPCEDGLFCTTGDTCQTGAVCQSGLPTDCTGLANDCNTAACDEARGACVRVPRGDSTPCTGDGDNCTVDACKTGVCLHPALPSDCGARVCGNSPNGCYSCGACAPGFGCGSDGQCSDLCAGVTCPECQGCANGACVPAGEGNACTTDGNACTSDTCSAGACVHPAVGNGQPCNDGSACTRTDTCVAGACTGGDPLVCTALNECHVTGVCNPGTGVCTNPMRPNGWTCTDDGNACTDDLCQAGACGHPNAADGQVCNDGNACTRIDACQAGACTGISPVVCPTPQDCRSQGTCDTTTGLCSDPAEADGVPCTDDGNECTGDACVSGACEHPARQDATPCGDDGKTCTLDACASGVCGHVRQSGCLIDGACVASGASNPANPCLTCDQDAPTGWSNVTDGTGCEDGAYCSIDDQCQAGACQAGIARDCAFQDSPCATGRCDEATDGCKADPKTSDTPCGDDYSCADGVLVLADRCDGNGACTDNGTSSCAPYAGCKSAGVCATSCATGPDCMTGFRCLGNACTANHAPTASAGEAQTVDEGTPATLDGSGSTDPDLDLLTYEWTQIGEPAVELDDPAAAKPAFTAPLVDEDTALVFQLVVRDGLLASTAVQVTITVKDVATPPEGTPEADEDAVQPDGMAPDAATDASTDEVPATDDTASTDAARTDDGAGAPDEGRFEVVLVDASLTDDGAPAKKGGGCNGAPVPTGGAPLAFLLVGLACLAFGTLRRRAD
jgi:hypothetical protein